MILGTCTSGVHPARSWFRGDAGYVRADQEEGQGAAVVGPQATGKRHRSRPESLLRFGQSFTTISLVVNPDGGIMHIGNLRKPNDKAFIEDLKKILAQLAQLQAGQAERDKERDRREARQNKWQAVQLIIAVATVGGVVVAIIAGSASLAQQREAAAQQDQASRYSSVSQLSLDLDKTVADHPRLISCFYNQNCDAKPPLTMQEIQQARALAGYIVDFYQYLYAQLENLGYVPNSGLFTLRKDATPTDNESWITWSETIVAGFADSSLVCTVLKEASDAYEQRFVHAVAVANVCPGLPDPGPSPY